MKLLTSVLLILLAFLVPVFLISIPHDFNVNNDIGPNCYIINKEMYSAGARKLIINLDVLGKAIVMAMPDKDYRAFQNNSVYHYYTFISDQPFNAMHTETDFINIHENFYIVIINPDTLEKIHVKGKVTVIEPIDIVLQTIIGIALTVTFLSIIILTIHKYCKKTQPVVYVQASGEVVL